MLSLMRAAYTKGRFVNERERSSAYYECTYSKADNSCVYTRVLAQVTRVLTQFQSTNGCGCGLSYKIQVGGVHTRAEFWLEPLCKRANVHDSVCCGIA